MRRVVGLLAALAGLPFLAIAAGFFALGHWIDRGALETWLDEGAFRL